MPGELIGGRPVNAALLEPAFESFLTEEVTMSIAGFGQSIRVEQNRGAIAKRDGLFAENRTRQNAQRHAVRRGRSQASRSRRDQQGTMPGVGDSEFLAFGI